MTTLASNPRPDDHDWHSRTYADEWIASATSRAGTRGPELAKLASLFPFDRQEEIRVLDVGGGHGEVTIAVLDAWPLATVTLQDFSEPMLDTARERLAPYGDRVAFVRSDLTDSGWSRQCGGPFHAVVSAIAIHNVGDPATIRSIYAEVFDLVLTGGGFFNLDYCFMAGPAMSDLYARLLNRPPTAYSGGGFQEREPASLANQLRWLEEIGFDEVDCIWKEERRALLCGLRH